MHQLSKQFWGEIMNKNKIVLAGEEYEIYEELRPQMSLHFYIDNPRIYSKFDRTDDDPTEQEIEELLCKMDSVRELRNAIESTGGLVEPLQVIDGNNIVVEGNRRLAAYRLLGRKDPVKWSMVRCTIFPKDISEKAVFALIGQYHLIGQEPWSPFETAGYLYRRIQSTKSSIDSIAKELSMKKSEIKKMYEIYDFMVQHNDLQPDHWSYYVEYLKSKKIREVRSSHPELDNAVVSSIISNEITDARKDIREKLEVIAKMPKSIADDKINKFISGKSLDECYHDSEVIKDISGELLSFRRMIASAEIQRSVKRLSTKEKEQYEYELKGILDAVQRMLKSLQEEDSD